MPLYEVEKRGFWERLFSPNVIKIGGTTIERYPHHRPNEAAGVIKHAYGEKIVEGLSQSQIDEYFKNEK